MILKYHKQLKLQNVLPKLLVQSLVFFKEVVERD